MKKEKVMALVEELKSQGHHGYMFGFGDSIYLFDKTDQVVYNAKTGHKLKWLTRENLNKYIEPTDGHGHRAMRLYLHQLNKYNTWKEFYQALKGESK